MDNQLDGSSR